MDLGVLGDRDGRGAGSSQDGSHHDLAGQRRERCQMAGEDAEDEDEGHDDEPQKDDEIGMKTGKCLFQRHAAHDDAYGKHADGTDGPSDLVYGLLQERGKLYGEQEKCYANCGRYDIGVEQDLFYAAVLACHKPDSERPEKDGLHSQVGTGVEDIFPAQDGADQGHDQVA